jgi:hypothetical protein
MFKKIISAALSLAVLLAAMPLAASAVTSSGAGQGLEISPPLFDLKANPGQTLSAKVRLRNVTQETVQTKAQYDDFVAGDEEGLPKILLDQKEKSPYSIKDWLSSIPSVTLAPGEQKTLDIQIAVPGDAGPGGHYGVIRFTAAPPEVDQSAVSLSASVGSLILVSVSGDVQEKATIEQLAAAKGGKVGTAFEYGPIDIITRIKNSGNVHFKPSGTVRVTNIFGKEVASFELNERRTNVLPSSIRKYENRLDKKLLFGKYNIQADVVYGADNKIASETASFWVIPYKLIAITIAAIILIIFLIRNYNRYIAKRAVSKSGNGKKKK